jgi:hypothetical protein
MLMKPHDTEISKISVNDDDMDVPEFDFDHAVPNTYAERFTDGVAYQILGLDGVTRTFIQLDADVAKDFPSSKAVNDILRSTIQNKHQIAGK